MKAGLLGLSLSGKTSVFGALTALAPEKISALAHGEQPAGRHFGFMVMLPDARLHRLAKMYEARKVTAVGMEWMDLPGLEMGQGAGGSRNATTLAALRQVDILVCVLRAFASESVPHPKGEVAPRRDLDVLRSELLLADLDSVMRRIEKLEKSVHKPTPTQEQDKMELALLMRCREAIQQEIPLREVIRRDDEQRMVRGFGFLSEKPLLCVLNVGEDDLPARGEVFEAHADLGDEVCVVSALLEWELAQLSAEDRPEFMAEMGITSLAGPRILEAVHRALGRIVFYTVSEKEVRAWSIPKPALALDAAGAVHTDMARGFIRAEVIGFDALDAAGSMKEAKQQNLVRLEGKHYEVVDGDVIFFRFHV
ncbi:MAG: DUF933 domain-containing protein [Planctomycetia bacterium]|nr:DUF933 domain-containing protein [Planctomycetia bacterium]